MNLLLLLVLLLPFFITPAFGVENGFIFTDKSKYYSGESIKVFGTGLPPGEFVSFEFRYLNENSIYGKSLFTDNEGNFLIAFDASHTGNYKITTRSESGELYTFFSYDNELESPLDIQTDKEEYYNSQDIIIMGTTNQIGTVDIDFSYLNGTAMPIEYYTDIISGKINGTIHTDDYLWDDYLGYVIVNATVNDSWNTAVFHYSNTEDMTDKAQHERLNVHEDKHEAQDKKNEEYGDVILSLQEELAALTLLVNILSEIDLLDAPIIIGLVADDPDNQDDVYGIDDTITILFDSDTNMPGGGELLRKVSIDNLFTFSDYMGSAYQGIWINASAFEITVKSVDDALIAINSTIVTPTLETLILATDNNPVNFSTETSPPLTGTWGTLTQ